MEDTEVMAVDADRLAELCENDSAVGYNLMLRIDQIYFERYRIDVKQESVLTYTLPPRIIRPNRQHERGS